MIFFFLYYQQTFQWVAQTYSFSSGISVISCHRTKFKATTTRSSPHFCIPSESAKKDVVSCFTWLRAPYFRCCACIPLSTRRQRRRQFTFRRGAACTYHIHIVKSVDIGQWFEWRRMVCSHLCSLTRDLRKEQEQERKREYRKVNFVDFTEKNLTMEEANSQTNRYG